VADGGAGPDGVKRPALVAGADGASLRLRVRPGASRNAVLGRGVLADGSEVVVVAVSAPPEDGRANRAVIELLAETWDLPRRAVAVTAGAAARTKTIGIADPAAGPRLAAWLESLPLT